MNQPPGYWRSPQSCCQKETSATSQHPSFVSVHSPWKTQGFTSDRIPEQIIIQHGIHLLYNLISSCRHICPICMPAPPAVCTVGCLVILPHWRWDLPEGNSSHPDIPHSWLLSSSWGQNNFITGSQGRGLKTNIK